MSVWKSHLFVTNAAFVLSIFMLLLHKCCCINTGRGEGIDHLALLAIKARITSDPMRFTSSWNDSLHFCQWKGISCSKRHKTRVTALNFRSWNLFGSLSPSLGNLSFLKNVEMSNNIFHGEIPNEIGQLSRLQVLILTNNSFGGLIPPNISFCSRLRVINLDENEFTGKLPTELGSLSLLLQITADYNSFTGPIPPSFGNLSSLEHLRIRHSMLEGSIPDLLGRLKSLRYLTLTLNNLSGMIPPSIYNLSLLANLSLAGNHFQGNVPNNLGLTLPNLRWLSIWGNQLGGSIPASLSNASKLELLDMSMNEFSRGVPIDFGSMQKLYWLSLFENELGSGESNDLNFIFSLTNCSALRVLYLNGNDFGGVLPNAISNLSAQLQVLSFYGNRISGSIPTGIGNLVNLNSLDMQSNQLSGSIPSSIGLLNKLQEVGFGGNKLSGFIPSSFGNLTLLNQLWLEENNFQGSVPSSLGNCTNLLLLHLYENNLSGSIPREVIGLSALSKSLNLARNQLSGSIPLEVGNLRNLVELNVSHNELSGEIPIGIGSCVLLRRLYMDHNSFGGAIPHTLSSLKGMEELDLSHNNLLGRIPQSLGTLLVLQHLNLSFNELEGEVPIGGVFGNASTLSVSGNAKLCGGVPELHLPVCSTKKTRKRKLSLVLKLVLPLVLGVIGITSISLFLILSRFIIKRRKQPSSAFWSVEPFPIVSYGQLLKATDGFSSANLIDSGSFGAVYKGNLEDSSSGDQIVVAVKVLNLHNKGASKSFVAECEALKNIRHRNLIKILTVCSTVDYNGNDFKALVYQFMENGSLETWLYTTPQADGINEEPKRLGLLQRLTIAIDIASALDYLHNQCLVPIVHCDLKPSNILLDVNMAALVSDFGLSRLLERQPNDGFSQNQTSSSAVIKGTIGYTPPEYGMGSEVSKFGDVYSYGILLLEMFTGKRPTDDMFKDGLNLHKLAVMALPEQVMEIADWVLIENISISEAQSRREEIKKGLVSIFRIGVACSMESPMERMKIFEAAVELKLIKDMFLRIGLDS